MGDAKLSVTHASYFPPSLQPEFMGAYPPTKTGYGSLYDNGNINYFQDYRNEKISRIQFPAQDWGIAHTPYSPRADLVAANKVCNWNRMLSSPKYNMTMVDPGRQQEVDDFYKACQLHRDQYKDHTGSLHPLSYFRRADYMFQCPPELTRTYFKFPQYYVKYKSPQTLPKTLDRSLPCPSLPDRSLAGRYDRASTTVYKR